MTNKPDETIEEEKQYCLVSVKVIEVKGDSALVQWGPDEDPRRAFVATYEINKDGHIDSDVLKEYPCYGLPWEEVLDPKAFFTVESLASALRKAGVWTYEDLEQKDRQVARIAATKIGYAVWHAARRATKEKGNA